MPNTKPVPEGFHTVTPQLVVRDALKAIDFYKRAFGAEHLGINYGPDGKVRHAVIKIGDSIIMLNDEFPDWGALSPLAPGHASSVVVHLYVENVDTLFARAVSAGGKVTMPLMDQFWGDRYGQIVDPFGHKWSLATHTRDLTPEEMRRAGEAATESMGK